MLPFTLYSLLNYYNNYYYSPSVLLVLVAVLAKSRNISTIASSLSPEQPSELESVFSLPELSLILFQKVRDQIINRIIKSNLSLYKRKLQDYEVEVLNNILIPSVIISCSEHKHSTLIDDRTTNNFQNVS